MEYFQHNVNFFISSILLIKTKFSEKNIQVENWMELADTNKDGVLSYDEFKQSLDGVIDL